MKKIFIFILFFFITFINVMGEGNYITAIKVDGKDLEGFESSKTDYNINVKSDKESIVLGYIYDTNMYTGVGSSGDVSLSYGENKLTYTLTNKNDSSDTKIYNIVVNREDNRSTDNSLSNLMIGNNKVILGVDNDYTVLVDSKLTSVEVKPTLASDKASFVDGYGERVGNNAVKLSGEVTSFEIRVKAENGSIRTYKINVKKFDYKSNDASLKSITIDGLEFDFNSKTYEYNLSVNYDVIILKIKAVPNDTKATLDYKETVSLKNGLNEIEVKVKAEDGSEQIYKLNITREEEVPIVSDIKIKDIDFEFDPKTYNYKIETELTSLEFNVTLSKETATSEILNNENLKNGSVIKVQAKDGDKTVVYNFRIINDIEEEKDVSEVIESSNDGFFQKYEMIIALAVFGIGLLSMIFAIVLKPKSKIM